MATHVWNLGTVQNQQFPNRITLVHAASGKLFYALISNAGGGPVKILRGSQAVASLPPGQSVAVAADADLHLELEEGQRRGATGSFSLAA